MLTPNEAYQYDSTFRRVVDLMCAYLSEYQITPSELRQAAILAATMHENRRIKYIETEKLVAKLNKK
jgi:predicted chitinase